jgi:riboflavin-specific deaminase-like protein
MTPLAVNPRDPEAEWRGILSALTGEDRRAHELCGPLAEIFAPLIKAHRDGSPLVVAQIGQSLDGRVATVSGESQSINGDQGIAHLHRLRALVNGVVIGVDTAICDDPRLTVRHVDGKSPARIVIDPNGRLPPNAKLLQDDGARRILVRCGPCGESSCAEQIRLPKTEGRIAPRDILRALAERGIHRVLIEGGPKTVAAFIADGCVDRLHVIVAPVLIGSGRPSLDLPPIARLAHAVRPPTRVCLLATDEALFDMDLSAHRRA